MLMIQTIIGLEKRADNAPCLRLWNMITAYLISFTRQWRPSEIQNLYFAGQIQWQPQATKKPAHKA